MRGYRGLMARPARYASPEDEELVRRNPRAAEISERLVEQTRARVERRETGQIDAHGDSGVELSKPLIENLRRAAERASTGQIHGRRGRGQRG
jgi:hypothetical protein